MKYGFIIDNRKCIGCHACTVACKSEHDVPIGVNRTWVKQVEKGEYPNTRRLFSVMRCNHCTDAPCVEICPVEALHYREDGIVDFDNERCIGCKACMQACPYDALYIDPNSHTAAKCNYCAHRVDVGLEPACVNVCPEHAIVSGDMEDPNSEISQLLAREQVSVRKPEKGTMPNVYYIDGDESSLTPAATERSDQYMWNSQSQGVGHFAKYAEKLAGEADVIAMAKQLAGESGQSKVGNGQSGKKQIEVIMENAKRVYDSPDKGVLWGWEVSAYIWTKAIAAGAFLLPFIAIFLGGFAEVTETIQMIGLGAAILFLTITGILLVMDLDQPKRFLYVLFRPQWKSWLSKGSFAITGYGAFLAVAILGMFVDLGIIGTIVYWIAAALAILTAVYTAFLFAQARGRDFWQSPMLSVHMLVHSIMAGAALFALVNLAVVGGTFWESFVGTTMMIAIGINLIVMLLEFATTHPTADSKTTAKMITKGKYKNAFWGGTVLLGNIIPLALTLTGNPMALAAAGACVLIGIYITEDIWVKAPQQIQLV
jgi:Fe-S-cluster-containing dehydrogenase component/formate-dependent nitrite reductase membrane component NrfD